MYNQFGKAGGVKKSSPGFYTTSPGQPTNPRERESERERLPGC